MAKMKYQGREVETTPVEIIHQQEHTNEYQLADGTLVKVRVVVLDIVKIEGEFDANGGPLYNVNSKTVTSARKA